MIIGITGTLGAGKGTVVEYLKTKGFKHYSASGFIKEEIIRRGLPVNRDTMSEVANDLRAKRGAAYIIEELFLRAQKEEGDCVIEAIHEVAGAEFLKSHGAVMIGVDADLKTRYERIYKRGSEKDHVTFEKFVEDNKRETESTDPAKHNIAKVMEVADIVVTNNTTQAELFAQVEAALQKYTR